MSLDGMERNGMWLCVLRYMLLFSLGLLTSHFVDILCFYTIQLQQNQQLRYHVEV